MADLGDVLPFSAKLYSAPPDEGGVLTNALSAALVITLPDGSTAAGVTVSGPVSTGVYQYDYVAAMPGRYVGRWLFAFAGGKTTAYVETFDVRPADPGYLLSLSAARAALNIPATSPVDDEEIRSMLESVTTTVEAYRGEVIVRRTIVESLTAGKSMWEVAATRFTASRRLTLARAPVLSVTSIVRPYDGVTWDSTTAVLVNPAAGVLMTYGMPFYGDIVVTYVAGYQVIPPNFIEAAKIILRHLWQTQQTPGMGSRVFGVDDAAPLGFGFAVPNRAAELLGGKMPTIA